MKKTTVMLVDDHSVVRMGLSAIINLEKDLKVCGEAENGPDTVELAKKLKPDVVVMDFMMPGMDGAEATAAVLKASPSSHVLILTTYGSSADISRALSAGATGAVTKNLSNSDLAEAIRATARGGTPPFAGDREQHKRGLRRTVVHAAQRQSPSPFAATC